jgi:hypothetical protein
MNLLINDDQPKSVTDVSDAILEYNLFKAKHSGKHHPNVEMESLDYENIDNVLTQNYLFSKTMSV